MKEDATNKYRNAVNVIQDGQRTSPVTVRDIGSLEKALEEFAKPKDDKYEEIDVSWINSAVNQKLMESRFSPYELINVSAAPYKAAAYGGGIMVAVAMNGLLAYTVNGGGSFDYQFLVDGNTLPPDISYEDLDKYLLTGVSGIAYGNGNFLVSFSTGKILKISDPTQPGFLLNAPQAPYSDIAASGNTFVGVTGDGRIFRSEDKGESWTEAEAPEAVQFTAVTAGAAGVFAAVANNGEKRCAMSADYGQTWTAYEMPEQNQWVDIAYSDTHKTFAACSLDGENRFALWDGENVKWRAVKAPAQNSWRAIAAGNGIFTAVSSDGALQAASSYDGKKWYSIETPAGSWASLARTARFFIAFSSSGGADGANAMRSSNGGLTSALFADTDETKAGQEVSKAVSPKTLRDFINSRLPWSVENGGTGAETVSEAIKNLEIFFRDRLSEKSLDDITEPGFYFVCSDCTNKPGNNVGWLLVLYGVGGQIFIDFEGMAIYYRDLDIGGYKDWVQLTQQPGDYATKTMLIEGLATKQPVGDYATNLFVNALAAKVEQKQDKLSLPLSISDGGTGRKDGTAAFKRVEIQSATGSLSGYIDNQDSYGVIRIVVAGNNTGPEDYSLLNLNGKNKSGYIWNVYNGFGINGREQPGYSLYVHGPLGVSGNISAPNMAPKPTTAAKAGQVIAFSSQSKQYTLPAGGTWVIFAMFLNQTYIGVHPGGTTLTPTPGNNPYGFAWRIA